MHFSKSVAAIRESESVFDSERRMAIVFALNRFERRGDFLIGPKLERHGVRSGLYQAQDVRGLAPKLNLQSDSLVAVSRKGPGVRACELPELRSLWPETPRPAPKVPTTPEDAHSRPASGVGDEPRAKQEVGSTESDRRTGSAGENTGGLDAGLSQAAPARPRPMKPENPS